MYVRRLELVDFRSYAQVEVEFEPGPSVLVGPNGIGKTNLVEALGYVATLDSHRVATDAPLVRAGAERGGRPLRDRPRRARAAGRARDRAGQGQPGPARTAPVSAGPRDILGALRMVLFAPEDLALVRGDPAERRRYLDDLLVARQPRFAGVRADYDRVLKQRNALLRTAYLARKIGGRRSAICPRWTSGTRTWPRTAPSCSPAGSSCAPRSRRTWPRRTTRSAPGGGERTDRPTRSGLVERSARPGPCCQRGSLLGAAGRGPEAEIERGVTLVGPHRDDVTLTLGELPAKGYASHGESWSFALALRLAAYELLRADGIEPVLVLDDVFAELDAGRRDRLAELVGGASQVLVTCAVEDDVPAALAGRAIRRSTEGGVDAVSDRRTPPRPGRRRAVAAPSSARGRAGRGPRTPGSRRASRRPGRRPGAAGGPAGYSGPGPDPRDPQPFGAVLGRLVKSRGWQQPAAEARGVRRVGAGGRRRPRRAQPAGQAGGRRAHRRGRVDRLGDPAAPAGRQAAEPDRRRGRPERGDQAAHPRPGRAVLGQRAAPGARPRPRDTYG